MSSQNTIAACLIIASVKDILWFCLAVLLIQSPGSAGQQPHVQPESPEDDLSAQLLEALAVDDLEELARCQADEKLSSRYVEGAHR